MSYLALAKQAEARLRLEGKPSPEAILRNAYRSFWHLQSQAPLDDLQAVLTEIRKAEGALAGDRVLEVLRQASEAWYRETRRCPFCGGPDLHSPAEAILEGAA